MFTGIIEEMGTVNNISRGADCMKIGIVSHFGDIKTGDSIAVNGICLTAAKTDGSVFEADVMPETVERTSLKDLRRGSAVNLERAMIAGGRFGGHIVTGHIDCTAVIKSKKTISNAVWIEFSTENTKYMVEKGSVAIDGISLTITAVQKHGFAVSVIPHTLAETVLGIKHAGDLVNIEFDIIGKYVEKLCQRDNSLNKEFLSKYGFLD